MLGDVDQQQSSLAWLRRRDAAPEARSAPIVGWASDAKSVLRPPPGVTHVVLDTPGGVRGLELARVVMNADAILMPVCNSAFDRESTLECHAELMTLPRISSGRCKVALVGMRLDARTRAGERLERWAARHHLSYIGGLREAQVYVRCADQGLTVFDLPQAKVAADIEQWASIIHWIYGSGLAQTRIDMASNPAAKALQARRAGFLTSTARPPSSLMSALTTASPGLPTPAHPAARPSIAERLGGLLSVFKSPH
jgi:chromosome partitioning protein